MIAHLWGCENRAGALRLDRTPVHRAEWIALDETATALRSWASARRDLLEGVEGVWPQDRSRRCRPDPEGTDRVRTVLDNWDLESGPSALDAVAGREIAQIEQAILQGDDRLLEEEYGDLQDGPERIVELSEQAHQQAGWRLNPRRQHLANGAPLRGALPMIRRPPMPRMGCENDVGGRFTDDPGRDSQRHGSRFLCGCCGYAWCCPVGAANRAAPTGTGATPPADALVMAWAGAGFHKPCTAPGGVAPVPMIPGGKAVEPIRGHKVIIPFHKDRCPQ